MSSFHLLLEQSLEWTGYRLQTQNELASAIDTCRELTKCSNTTNTDLIPTGAAGVSALIEFGSAVMAYWKPGTATGVASTAAVLISGAGALCQPNKEKKQDELKKLIKGLSKAIKNEVNITLFGMCSQLSIHERAPKWAIFCMALALNYKEKDTLSAELMRHDLLDILVNNDLTPSEQDLAEWAEKLALQLYLDFHQSKSDKWPAFFRNAISSSFEIDAGIDPEDGGLSNFKGSTKLKNMAETIINDKPMPNVDRPRGETSSEVHTASSQTQHTANEAPSESSRTDMKLKQGELDADALAKGVFGLATVCEIGAGIYSSVAKKKNVGQKGGQVIEKQSVELQDGQATKKQSGKLKDGQDIKKKSVKASETKKADTAVKADWSGVATHGLNGGFYAYQAWKQYNQPASSGELAAVLKELEEYKKKLADSVWIE